MNRKNPLSEILPDASPGISLSRSPFDIGVFGKGSVPAGFESIEVSGSSDPNRMRIPCGSPLFRRRYLSDVVDASLSGNVADQSRTLIDQFLAHIAQVADSAADAQIEAVTLDISLETAFARPDARSKRIDLLKRMMPLFRRAGVNVLLPINVPYLFETIDVMHLDVLRETMSAELGLSLDIYPHRLGRDFDPTLLLRWIRFDLRMVRFVYELELGNRLVESVIAPWLLALEKINFSGSVLFCPIISDENTFLDELDCLGELLSAFANNQVTRR